MNLRKTFKSFGFAFRGFLELLRSENNFQVHFLAAASVILLGIFTGLSNGEWALLVLLIVLVFAAEGFNTAIEQICDFIQLEHHPKIGRIKDIAAASVLVIAVGAVVIGFLIFYPKYF